MPVVTLVVAAGPGYPQGSPDHRYEMTVELTPGGHLDAKAWAEAPQPWPARRLWPGGLSREGDVHFDPDTEGWSIRLFPGPGEAADAPLHAQLRNAGQLRPGAYVTIAEPNGVEYSYRVVGVV
ncbi:hypothetical protein [Roseicella frigidaeris]|uniref:Uncharacterized protein n=1 Tax=Roseicella frigidaeris TaxID=2230885 RepID=A0A327M8A8_9PROT|nr:hypothetical protein [Roseicella frigidaeris]RAI59541.1 hypothetical protein DOO78_08055 [Roseicella frigidaeris]